MVLFINFWGLVFLKYQIKQGRLHQGLDYIAYLNYGNKFIYITVVLKVEIHFRMFSLNVIGCSRNISVGTIYKSKRLLIYD